MRKASKKVNYSYNTGKRVGLMLAIAQFYDDNGVNDKTISQLKGVKALYCRARQEELESEKELHDKDNKEYRF